MESGVVVKNSSGKTAWHNKKGRHVEVIENLWN